MTFVSDILTDFAPLSKPRASFLVDLFTAMSSFMGRATMSNLARFGAGSARRVARWFRKPFAWHALNLHALDHEGVLAHRLAACTDATFLSKSGKKTYGLAKFHCGTTGRTETGCEAIHLGLLDLDERTAYTLSIKQTPATLEANKTRLDFYIEHVRDHTPQLRQHGVNVMVADGAFAKRKFIDAMQEQGLHVVGKLRKDASLHLPYDGPTGKRGRPNTYGDKVDLVNLYRLEERCYMSEKMVLFEAEVLSKSMGGKRIKVVIVRKHGEEKNRAILFSTDTSLSGKEIVELYKLRFQEEFLFRDGKQHTGLADGQMRDKVGRREHLEASMWTLNMMRLEDRARQQDKDGEAGECVQSMERWKKRNAAHDAAKRFLKGLGQDPNHPKFTSAFDDLDSFYLDAA